MKYTQEIIPSGINPRHLDTLAICTAVVGKLSIWMNLIPFSPRRRVSRLVLKEAFRVGDEPKGTAAYTLILGQKLHNEIFSAVEKAESVYAKLYLSTDDKKSRGKNSIFVLEFSFYKKHSDNEPHIFQCWRLQFDMNAYLYSSRLGL